MSLEFVKSKLLDEELKTMSRATSVDKGNDEVTFKAFPFACYKCGKNRSTNKKPEKYTGQLQNKGFQQKKTEATKVGARYIGR